MGTIIRKAVKGDLPSVVEILNHGIRTRHSVGYFTSRNEEEMKDWFMEHLEDERYTMLIADCDGDVAGWITLSPYRKGREAFNRTGEISAYIHEQRQRSGLGQALLDAILQHASEKGFRIIFAIVLDRNLPSIKLLEKNHFERWAFLPEVAEIDGVMLNHIYFGKKLN